MGLLRLRIFSALILCGWLLAACSNTGISQGASHNRVRDKAVVVIGVASTVEDGRVSRLGLWFGRHDPATGEWLRDEMLSDKFFAEKEVSRNWFSGQSLDATQPNYVVLEVNPGEWTAWAIANTFGMVNRSTRFIPRGEDRLGASVGPRFSIKAGETIYIGTFRINPVTFPAQLVAITREDGAARQALAGTGIRDELVFRMARSVGAAPAQADNSRAVELEAYLAQALSERRYADVDAALRQLGSIGQATKALNWLRARMLSGGGAYVVLTYSRLLMEFGESQPQLKDTAAMAALYAQGLAMTEAVRCDDRSAAQARLLYIAEVTRPMTQHLMQLPLERRQMVVDNAIGLEEQLAPKRRDDDWLCRGGARAMSSALARAQPSDVKQVDTPPGHVGRTFTVPDNPDYRPGFLAESEWRPEQVEGRARFQKTVREIFLNPEASKRIAGSATESPAANVLPVAPSAPPQIAKAPTAVARPASVDGEYRTTVPANLFNGNPAFEMRIAARDGRITGYGIVPRTAPMHCRAKGTMPADGDAYFEIDCATGGIGAIQTFQVSGRFSRDADGKVAGNTSYQLSSGPRGTLLWQAM